MCPGAHTTLKIKIIPYNKKLTVEAFSSLDSFTCINNKGNKSTFKEKTF